MIFDQWWEHNKWDILGYDKEKSREVFNCAYLLGQIAGLEEAAQVAEAHMFAPPSSWGKGATYNAKKIMDVIRAKICGVTYKYQDAEARNG
jgi:hypothetical protein